MTSDEPLWRLEDVINIVGGALYGRTITRFSGVSIDSRTCQGGDIFIALRGETRDGAIFAPTALATGSGLAIISQDSLPLASEARPILITDDSYAALNALAQAARKRTGATVTAITGSVGKTTTKDALARALTPFGPTHAALASHNNHLGVPLTLARMPAGAAYAICELGMNHPGEIAPLSRLVKPHVAVITSITESHLAQFTSLAGIADEKATIFDGMMPDGSAIIARDIIFFERLAAKARQAGVARIISFGRDPQSDIRLLSSRSQPQGGTKNPEARYEVTASFHGQRLRFSVAAPGEHFALNLLAALAVVDALGQNVETAAHALRDLTPGPGRGAQCVIGRGQNAMTLIDDSYNANPASVRAGLTVLRATPPRGRGRRIAVLGDMLELGEQATSLHEGLLDAVTESGADLVYLCGPLMAALWARLPGPLQGEYAPTSQDLREPLLKALRPGDVIFIKGSLGTRMGPLAKAIAQKFADATPPTAPSSPDL